MTSEYLTAAKRASTQIEIKKSKFLASVSPVADEAEASAFVAEIREKHRSANHNVFAYTVGSGGLVKRFSDDGEPSGTAGRPVMEVIDRQGLRDVAVVVTRYFGGILLGAPGLIRAYGEAANLGIREAGLVARVLHDRRRLTFECRPGGESSPGTSRRSRSEGEAWKWWGSNTYH